MKILCHTILMAIIVVLIKIQPFLESFSLIYNPLATQLDIFYYFKLNN